MTTPTFTTAYWCILAAVVLPMLCAYVAKMGGKDRFDNTNPRAWLARQEGRQARANAAQANGFEALPFFIGAVIVAHLLGADQGRIDMLALAFIALRVAYSVLYIGGASTLRSIVWLLAFLVNIGIFLSGWR